MYDQSLSGDYIILSNIRSCKMILSFGTHFAVMLTRFPTTAREPTLYRVFKCLLLKAVCGTPPWDWVNFAFWPCLAKDGTGTLIFICTLKPFRVCSKLFKFQFDELHFTHVMINRFSLFILMFIQERRGKLVAIHKSKYKIGEILRLFHIKVCLELAPMGLISTKKARMANSFIRNN